MGDDNNPLKISVKEWKEVLDSVEAGGYKEWRKAMTWVLVECFGTREEYWNDALFHYKVETAVEMIQRLGKTGGQWNPRNE